jgi:hypothetical protein
MAVHRSNVAIEHDEKGYFESRNRHYFEYL